MKLQKLGAFSWMVCGISVSLPKCFVGTEAIPLWLPRYAALATPTMSPALNLVLEQ